MPERESDEVRVSVEEAKTRGKQRRKQKKEMKVGERKMVNLMFNPFFLFV